MLLRILGLFLAWHTASASVLTIGGNRSNRGLASGYADQSQVEDIRTPYRYRWIIRRHMQFCAPLLRIAYGLDHDGVGALALADVRAPLPERPHAHASGLRIFIRTFVHVYTHTNNDLCVK